MEVRIWEKKNVCQALGTDFKVAGRLVPGIGHQY